VGAEDVIRNLLGSGTEITYNQNFDLAQVDEQPLQIRSEANLAPAKMVERYRVQMEYSIFPPIVVTGDYVLADGHTRVAARRLRGETQDRALVIALKWHGADHHTQARIQLIGQVINQTAGQSLDSGETEGMIRNCLGLGYGYDQTAAFSGASKSTIRGVEKTMKAEAKVPALRDTIRRLPKTVAVAVGGAADLHDEPFVGLAQLASDAAFKPSEVNELAKQVKSASSDDDAVAVIAARRAAEADRIARRAIGGNGHPPRSQSLLMHIGWINKHPAAELVEPREALQAKYLESVTSAADCLTELVRLQREANAS